MHSSRWSHARHSWCPPGITKERPAAPMPSLAIHLMAAPAAAAPSALLAKPTAFSRLEVARLVPIQPVIWAGTAHSWNAR